MLYDNQKRWQSMGTLFNPLYLITFQTCLTLILFGTDRANGISYYFVVLTPYVLYLPFYFLISRIVSKGVLTRTNKTVFNPISSLFSIVIILFVSAANVMLIIHCLEFYGGFSNAAKYFGSASIVTPLQREGPKILSQLVTANYLLPVGIIPILYNSNRRLISVVLILTLILCFLASGLYGARVLFIDAAFVCVIAIFSQVKFSKRISISVLTVISVSIFFFASLQTIRSNPGDLPSGFRTLGNYYAVSLNQGANIITSNTTRQPLYWTLKPLFDVPYLSNITGINGIYEAFFGHLPIKNRQDDFNYVRSLGGNPEYNTLSIYGYSYLDSGFWSVIIIFLSYIILQVLFSFYTKRALAGILLFPALYMLTTDQLRTNGIFSSRISYDMITFFLFVITQTIFSRMKKHKSNNFSRIMRINDQEVKL